MAKRKRTYSRKAPTKKRRTGKPKMNRNKPAQMSKLAAKMRNFSDFPIRQNSLAQFGMNDAAVIRTTDAGEVIVRHREYIKDILPTEDFTVQANLAINPGMEQLFPWLSGVASNFENYDIKGLAFEFKSLSSDAVLSASASTALGTVSMATQYNVLEDAFTNKRQLLNYQYANSAKPSISFVHPVECKRNPLDLLWVRTNNTDLGTSDRRLYDLGDFVLATEGCQGAAAGGSIGELWATIEVVFSKSKLRNIGDTDVFRFGTDVTGAVPFGTAITEGVKNNLGGTIDGTLYTFPEGAVGNYQATYWVVGGSVTLNYTGLEATNTTDLNVYGLSVPDDSKGAPVTGVASTSVMCTLFFALDPNTGQTTLGMTATTLPSSVSSDGAQLTVTRISDSIDIDPYVSG